MSCVLPNAAADLHLKAGGGNHLGDQVGLHGPPFLGAIEINDVEPACSGIGIRFGCFNRVDVVVDLLPVIPLARGGRRGPDADQRWE